MRLLLDTHAFLRWIADSSRLTEAARRAIANLRNDVAVSAASAWEIATKYRLGKLPGAELVARDVGACIAGQGFEKLAITVDDGTDAGGLPAFHRDPFDRMLIAQALARDSTLVSNEILFDRYGVRRLW